MFENYIRIALRTLRKNKLYSAINVIGLSFGLAACLLIALFVQFELSYDRFWLRADGIYRASMSFKIPAREEMRLVQSPGPLKSALERRFPNAIQHAARMARFRPVIIQDGEASENAVHLVDPDWLNIFDYQVIAGDLEAAMANNQSLAIARSVAEQRFGGLDALGQTLRFNGAGFGRDYQIVAIFEDIPDNTVFDYTMLGKLDEADFASQPWWLEQWLSANVWTYFTLKEGVSIETVRADLDALADAEIVLPTSGPVAGLKSHDVARLNVRPLQDAYLGDFGRGDQKPTGDQQQIMLFSAIALSILLIACINFINLSTAKATQRAREVALRKVHGADRKQVMLQFLGETILVALMALAIAMTLIELTLPMVSDLIGKDLGVAYGEPQTYALLLGLTLLVGVVGGSYPALVISNFRPSKVLKSNRSGASGPGWLREGLVLLQFVVSIILIIATSIVYGQKLYADQLDPGFERENLMLVHNIRRPQLADHLTALKASIEALPGVRGASYSSDGPASGNDNNHLLKADGDGGEMLIGVRQVDPDFAAIYDIEILAGRWFDQARALDREPTQAEIRAGTRGSGNIVLNREALSRFGFNSPEDAIGKVIFRRFGTAPDGSAFSMPLTVIGVVEDYRFLSLRRAVRPEYHAWSGVNINALTVAFTGNPEAMAAAVKAAFAAVAPEVPFRYEFVDQVMAAEFRQEAALANMLAVFALFAIMIACLGLYGLASFTAERRTKEIGVRKVLGARVSDIVKLFLWQFSKPVLIASPIAWLLAYVIMSNWLESFPLRLDSVYFIPLSLAAGLLALLIAWVTVGSNASQVARSNPVHALRDE